MEIIFLGTGTSHGVPMLGCDCKTCLSTNFKNKRYRSAVIIKTNKLTILIDTPPELRLQLMRANITNVDMILYTHAHADHLMGFDDIRGINRLYGQIIPCYGNKETITEIKHVFSYVFKSKQIGGGLPQVVFKEIKEELEFADTKIIPLAIKHGSLDILGYKIGKLAYITDCSFIPSKTFKQLADVELLIINALRFKKHSTHMNIEEALAVIKKLKVPQAYLTHIAHNIEHESVNKTLPENVQIAYDTLQISI